MTNTHSTEKLLKPKPPIPLRETSQRHYTVGYAPQGIITIKGKLLELLGFSTGRAVTTTV